jgi:hypothetical protein
MFAKHPFLSLLTFPADATLANPVIVGNRGACAYLPEHTLECAAMAHAMGVDYVEQDVVMTRDNELAVVHDHLLETVTRQYNGVCAFDAESQIVKDAQVGEQFEFVRHAFCQVCGLAGGSRRSSVLAYRSCTHTSHAKQQQGQKCPRDQIPVSLEHIHFQVPFRPEFRVSQTPADLMPVDKKRRIIPKLIGAMLPFY